MAALPTIIRENLGAKVIAVILALLVFGVVYLEGEQEGTLTVPLRLERLPEDRVVLEELPAQARIRVRAPGQLLVRLRLRDVDRSGLMAVVRHDPEEEDVIHHRLVPADILVPSNLGLVVLEVLSPTAINVALDELVSVVLHVVPSLVGEPPTGHVQSGEVTLDPEVVTVVGPRSRVGALTEVATEPVSLAPHDRPFRVAVAVRVPPGLRALPDSVEVSADIERSSRLRLRQVPVVVRNSRRYGVEVRPDTGAVTLVGPVSQLDQLSMLDAAGRPTGIGIVLDAAGLGPGEHALTPRVELTGRLRLVAIEPARFELVLRDSDE
jgi:hypothetical protein